MLQATDTLIDGSSLMDASPALETFTCKEFLELDKSLIDDFMDCTRESIEEIEVCVQALDTAKDDEQIHKLFRAMHSLKGNCRMVCLEPFAELLHVLEEIVSSLREHKTGYSSNIGEFLVLGSEHVLQMIQQLIRAGHASEMQRDQLHGLLQNLLQTPAEHIDACCTQAVHTLRQDASEEVSHAQPKPFQLPSDLELMQELACRLDNLSIYRRGRAEQVCQLAGSLNQVLQCPVDPEQLYAAALMHDVGMGFIPHSIFNKEGALSREELYQIQQHVNVGNLLLLRFGGWDEAARMVTDHHERYDGTGYPNRLQGEQIHLGARMLAIVDTFCSITNERSDRSFKKSLLSAITEINANSHTQFDPGLVEAFNDVVRQQIVKH